MQEENRQAEQLSWLNSGSLEKIVILPYVIPRGMPKTRTGGLPDSGSLLFVGRLFLPMQSVSPRLMAGCPWELGTGDSPAKAAPWKGKADAVNVTATLYSY